MFTMTQTTASHVTKSLSHLEAAKAARLALSEAYASPRQDRAEIAELHQTIGFGLKVAEVHALLANAVAAERFGTASRLG